MLKPFLYLSPFLEANDFFIFGELDSFFCRRRPTLALLSGLDNARKKL